MAANTGDLVEDMCRLLNITNETEMLSMRCSWCGKSNIVMTFPLDCCKARVCHKCVTQLYDKVKRYEMYDVLFFCPVCKSDVRDVTFDTSKINIHERQN